MKIQRKWTMPNSRTFKIKPIREFILANVSDGDVIIDAFANEASLSANLPENVSYITNDLDTQYSTTYNMDALEFLKTFDDNSVDFVLYDPPYSPRQVSECYKSLGMTVNMETTQASYWSKQKREISRIVKPGGKVITFGWNSGGIGKTNGFEIREILIVAHGGWHNDTICTLEAKEDSQ